MSWTAEQEAKASRIFWHYIDAVDIYLNSHMKGTSGNKRRDTPAQEEFRRKIEEACEVPEQGADDFRRQIAAMYGHLQLRNFKINWKSIPNLMHGIVAFVTGDPNYPLPEPTLHGRYRSIDEPWEPS